MTAMRRGDMILIDELNLAEDAVIERLNRHGRLVHYLSCAALHVYCFFTSTHGRAVRAMTHW